MAAIGNVELLQQIALLAWLNKSERGERMFTGLTCYKVGNEIYNRLSHQREVDQLKGQCVMAIAEYVKTHPKATEAELVKVVQKQLAVFKTKMATV